jgi:hypothetical protein
MEGRQRLQSFGSNFGESQTNEPTISLVSRTQDEPRCIRSIDEFDNAVVAQQQIIGNVAHCWSAGVSVSADDEKQLMLSWGQSSIMCLPLTPPFKTSETRP